MLKVVCCHQLSYRSFTDTTPGYKVCVLDAAVLLKAKWDRKCHEVWASIIPAKEVPQNCQCKHCIPTECTVHA